MTIFYASMEVSIANSLWQRTSYGAIANALGKTNAPEWWVGQ